MNSVTNTLEKNQEVTQSNAGDHNNIYLGDQQVKRKKYLIMLITLIIS